MTSAGNYFEMIRHLEYRLLSLNQRTVVRDFMPGRSRPYLRISDHRFRTGRPKQSSITAINDQFSHSSQRKRKVPCTPALYINQNTVAAKPSTINVN